MHDSSTVQCFLRARVSYVMVELLCVWRDRAQRPNLRTAATLPCFGAGSCELRGGQALLQLVASAVALRTGLPD